MVNSLRQRRSQGKLLMTDIEETVKPDEDRQQGSKCSRLQLIDLCK